MALQEPVRAFKTRRLRPSVFTEDEFNQSESDKRSFYSEVNINPEKKTYNFEERHEDYLEEDSSDLTKMGRQSLIVRPNCIDRQVQLSPFAKTTGLYIGHSDHDLAVRKQVLQPLHSEKPMMSSNRSALDYETLYRKIKLTPMLEQPQLEGNSIEPVDAKSLSQHPPWSHVSEQTSEVTQYPQSEQLSHPLEHSAISQVAKVGRIINSERVFMPQITVSESPKKMIDESLQTTFEQLNRDDSEGDETNFLKGIKSEMKGSQLKESSDTGQLSMFENVAVLNHLNSLKPRRLHSNRQPPQPIDSRGDEEDERPEQKQMKRVDPNLSMPSEDPQLHRPELLAPKAAESQLFDLPLYLQLYYCLRSIQNNLRNTNLLKSLKAYLQLIATGRVDNLDFLRVPLHKKKTLKLAMLYERMSVVVLAFNYATDRLDECQRYMSNLMRYTLHNYLTCLKVLTHQQNNEHYPQLSREQREVWALSNKQSLNKCFEQMKDNNEVLLETVLRLSKHDSLFYENLRKILKNSSRFTIEQTFYFVLEYFAFFLHLCELEGRVPFMAVSPNPYLTQQQPHRYTLVIDVLQTMCSPRKPQLFRPYAQSFLDDLSEHYEIVAFSAAFPNQLAKTIDHLDRRRRVEHRLFRHHTIKINGHYVKDVKRLGRDLSRVVMLESGEGSSISAENTILIKHWTGNARDTTLAQLCPILVMIAMRRMDARQAIAKYKAQLASNERSGVKYLNYGMDLV